MSDRAGAAATPSATPSVATAAADPQLFLASLVDGAMRALTEPVAAGVLAVERHRTLGDRMAGRPGPITEVRLTTGTETMSLRPASGQWAAETHRVSGGVVIARSSQTLGEWLNAFAGRVAAVAGDAVGDAAASRRALQALGIRSADADVSVGEQTLETDLQSLPARIAGRVPAEAHAEVSRIVGLLLDTAPRVASRAEAEFVVQRAATDYLPDTLRAYLALPSDWASGHVFRDGSTPDSALVAQLAVLRAAIEKLRESALAGNAEAMLVNGRFLSDRFTVSSVDLT